MVFEQGSHLRAVLQKDHSGNGWYDELEEKTRGVQQGRRLQQQSGREVPRMESLSLGSKKALMQQELLACSGMASPFRMTLATPLSKMQGSLEQSCPNHWWRSTGSSAAFTFSTFPLVQASPVACSILFSSGTGSSLGSEVSQHPASVEPATSLSTLPQKPERQAFGFGATFIVRFW